MIHDVIDMSNKVYALPPPVLPHLGAIYKKIMGQAMTVTHTLAPYCLRGAALQVTVIV